MQERQEEDQIIIVNGAAAAASTPVICADDAAMQFGHAVFETLLAIEGHVFQADRHLERLHKSSEFFGIACPSAPDLIAALKEALTKNQLNSNKRARLRITLAANREGKTTWTVEATAVKKYAESARAVLLPFARNERSAIAGHKTINYGENVIAQKFAADHQCEEGIFLNTCDFVCEGIWSNLFLKIDGRIFTPPLSSGCLPGITRALVLELAREKGIDILEEPIPISMLSEVESGWCTSTLRGMQKIGMINDQPLHTDTCKEWTILSTAYRKRVDSSYANS